MSYVSDVKRLMSYVMTGARSRMYYTIVPDVRLALLVVFTSVLPLREGIRSIP